MVKKIFIFMVVLTSLIYASGTKSKKGCTLAQEGKVIVNWQDKNKIGKVFNQVDYIPIKAQGINFREILVGSQIKISTKYKNQNKTITMKIVNIKSNKRVRPKPRTGSITIQILVDNIKKETTMDYIFDKGVMKAEGLVDIFDFSIIGFEMKIKAILCDVN